MIILGVGSNQGDRLSHLRLAYRLLSESKDFTVEAVSPVYMSNAELPHDAPPLWNCPYLNVAIRCSTALKPIDALNKLKSIETKMGRDPEHERWSPRLIDIDILFWADKRRVNEKSLQLPHQRLFDRPFALWPLEDIVPERTLDKIVDFQLQRNARDISKMWGSRFDGKSAPFKTRQIHHRVDTPYMVGILNVTPNSFSEGGLYFDQDKAFQHMLRLFDSGADVIDIGAESTRPHNQDRLSLKEEWNRLSPILKKYQSYFKGQAFKPKISIDTRSAYVAENALKFDIDFINDVSALEDPLMIDVVKEANVQLIFMHNLGIPPSKQKVLPQISAPLEVIKQWAEDKKEMLINKGVEKSHLIFDPGIGFGKTPKQNIEIIQKINELKSLKLPILVGHSRKSFLEYFTHHPPDERDLETAYLGAYLAHQGVEYLRVHDVPSVMQCLKVNKALV